MQEQRSFATSFARQRARYPLFCMMGLLIAFFLTARDSGLYFSVESGESDVDILVDLYFPYWSHQQVIDIGRAFFVGMLILGGYAIAIKVTQRRIAS